MWTPSSAPTWEIVAENRSIECYYYYCRCCYFRWWCLILVYFSVDHPKNVRQVLNVHFIWTREWVRKPSTIFKSQVCKKLWKMTWSEDIGIGLGEPGGTRQDLEKRAAPPPPPRLHKEFRRVLPTLVFYILENHICDRYSLVFLTGN